MNIVPLIAAFLVLMGPVLMLTAVPFPLMIALSVGAMKAALIVVLR